MIFSTILNLSDGFGLLMVFNPKFNNISITSISWRSALLVDETGVPVENHCPVVSH